MAAGLLLYRIIDPIAVDDVGYRRDLPLFLGFGMTVLIAAGGVMAMIAGGLAGGAAGRRRGEAGRRRELAGRADFREGRRVRLGAMPSATLEAQAMIVIIGLTPTEVGSRLPSAT